MKREVLLDTNVLVGFAKESLSSSKLIGTLKKNGIEI